MYDALDANVKKQDCKSNYALDKRVEIQGQQ